MFDDFSIGNSVSFGDFLKCSLRIFRVPTIIHHISVPQKNSGAFGTPAMMVRPNASERVKIKRLKCWMKYWTLACIKPSDKKSRTPVNWREFSGSKNNVKEIMGSFGIHGCLLYNFWMPVFAHLYTVWIRPRCDTDDQHQAGKKVTTSIAIRKLRFCQLHEKKIAAGSRVSSFMVSSHETSWKWAIHTSPSIYRIK